MARRAVIGAARAEVHPLRSQPATRYNVGVRDDSKDRALASETIGLIVIAVMLALMILFRWAGIIPWGAR